MRTTRKRSVPVLLGIAAAAAIAVPIYAVSAPAAGTKAPDLRADPVELIEGPGVYADTGSLGANRLLVRFEGYVTNIGDGPLEVSGNPQVSNGVRQFAWSGSQGPGAAPTVDVTQPGFSVVFEGADGHNHFHLKRAMEYSLWNLAKTAQVAPGQKVGFCLYDLDDAPPPSPAQDPQVYVNDVTQFCDVGNPSATSLRMGVSSGWRDVYDKSLAFQWVDVSKTSPGTYLVGSAADPDNTIWEGLNETNPRAFASQQVTVPGYVAAPVTTTQSGAPQTITLTAGTFGAPGPRRFTITSPPAHGTLGQATGAPFAGPTITYTPQPGYVGADSFSYVARDLNSQFPTSGFEPSASVTLTAGGPSVTISGAPASLPAGTSAQLSAQLAGLTGDVTWSTTAGTISPSGLFVAPATPPSGGTVTVRATSVASPTTSAQVVIAITAVAPAQPAPLPLPPVTTVASSKLLSRLSVGHTGRRIVVGTVTTGPKAGRVDVAMTFKGAVLGRCGARVGPRKTVSCRIVLKRDYALSKVRVTARFSILGRPQSVRRAYVVKAG